MNNENVDDYTAAIASVLRERYEKRGLSYADLAKQTGLGRATVERIINGKVTISVRALRAVSEALGLKPQSVMSAADKIEDSI